MSNKNLLLGIVLISAGIITGLTVAGILPGIGLLGILTIGFLTAYVVGKKTLGFLIPGCVLGAITIAGLVETTYAKLDDSFPLFILGLAFLAVFFIHTFRLKTAGWGEKYWPLFPAVSMMLIGGAVLAANNRLLNFKPEYLNYLNYLTPAILLIIGAVVLLKGFGKNKNA